MSRADGPARSPLVWTDHGNGFWTTTGPTGTHWAVRDFGSGAPDRFGVTVEHWDRPDWWAPTLEDAKALAAEIDARPPVPPAEQIPDRTVVSPEPGDDYVTVTPATKAPEGPCACGERKAPVPVKPRRETPEWWEDPSAYWRCPACGRHRGDVEV